MRNHHYRHTIIRVAVAALAACAVFGLVACAAPHAPLTDPTSALDLSPITQQQLPADEGTDAGEAATTVTEEEVGSLPEIDLIEDYRESFVHGDKGAAYQKYIVLHDTEGNSDPASVIDWWDSNGNLVAAHFVIGKDGTIYQCVPLDKIAHHAGYGDAGHNTAYGITEDGRDDMAGSVAVGSWAPDYGMNAWSIGIEMVHVGGSGPYPEEQLNALDALIAYIDAYYGFESTIIDHKAWRSGNSDTSPEFSEYLYNYQDHRRHTP
ncbi:MAG: N-acetylmuramoyl-L-alanine amidase [Coriobacteriales bacterium]|jgi:hypothetical protein|nr:N-acetylmuramoyl-L-alanine amidase [Coriobacteriales bacterium]